MFQLVKKSEWTEQVNNKVITIIVRTWFSFFAFVRLTYTFADRDITSGSATCTLKNQKLDDKIDNSAFSSRYLQSAA